MMKKLLILLGRVAVVAAICATATISCNLWQGLSDLQQTESERIGFADFLQGHPSRHFITTTGTYNTVLRVEDPKFTAQSAQAHFESWFGEQGDGFLRQSRFDKVVYSNGSQSWSYHQPGFHLEGNAVALQSETPPEASPAPEGLNVIGLCYVLVLMSCFLFIEPIVALLEAGAQLFKFHFVQDYVP